MTPKLLGTLLLSLALGCGGDTAPDLTRNLAVHQGNDQNGTVGQPVPTAPAVKVTDGSGAGVAGVAVTFSVASGGGTVTGGSQTTDAGGVARVGGWTLGQVAGATVEDLRAGTPVELVLDTLYADDEHEYLVWKWKVVD